MKRIFNKEKFIEDMKRFDPWLCEASKGWIDMCDGREVINGIVLGNKGEEYLVSMDWTDVVDDEKVTIDKQNNEKPVTKKVFSRDLYIEDMDKCVPEVDHAKTGWAMDCDGAEVIDGHAKGKKGVTYVVDDEWTKEVPVEAEESETEPKKEVKQKTKYIFSKEKFLATSERYYKWIDDCDGAEVLNGMAMGKSGIEYFMNPDWVKEVPATADGSYTEAGAYKIEIECNDDKTTTATLYKNGEKIDEAIARRSDKDTFDLFKGATLALDRLLL